METDYSLIITIGILIFIFIIFLLSLKKSREISNEDKKKIFNQLDDIKYSMVLQNPSTNRDGIVRLDALLSKSLQLRMKNSMNCGDNLKKAKPFLKKQIYNDIWHFHKLRNQIVHENIEIDDESAIKAYKVYSEVILKLIK